MDNSIYWKINRINSYDRNFNFVVGGRGIGKTYGVKKYCIEQYLKTGAEFIYLRRYKPEIAPLKKNSKYFEKMTDIFTDCNFKIKGEDCYIARENSENYEHCGYLLNLSTAVTKKSVDYSTVRYIIFDEFIIPKGNLHYLGNEVEAFLDFYETVDRMRDTTKVYFLSNALSAFNPYFVYFKIKPPKPGNFLKRENLVVEMCRQDAFIEAKKKTKFGQMIAGTNYGAYAIDNEFYLDDDHFIAQKPGRAKYYITLIYKDMKIGIWADYKDGKFYASKNVDNSCKISYSMTRADHTENTLYTKVAKPVFLKTLLKAYSYGLLYFESQIIKGYMMDIFDMCAI